MVLSNFGEGLLGLGAPELIIILVILLLIFGSKRLPELARSVGMSAKELRKGMTGDTSDTKTPDSDKDKPNQV